MWIVVRKELRFFFSSAIGYLIAGIFLVGTSLFLWVLPGEFNVLDGGYANVGGLFALAPWLYLFLCPAITMRMVAEERQTGTIETLLARPVAAWRIVAGKWVASWLLVVASLLPTVLWYVIVWVVAEPQGNVDGGAFWGSWIGLVLLAMVYCAVGVFGSSVTSSQIVAFVVSAIVCFCLYYGFELVGSLLPGGVAYGLRLLGINAHYSSLSRGVLDSRDLVYYVLVTVLFVVGAIVVVRRKR